jgi:hypothetical protein
MQKKYGSPNKLDETDESDGQSKVYKKIVRLDRKKIDVLLSELSEYLNFEDIFELKKQIN